MFGAFLSEDMTYSCPIWSPVSDPQSQGETLEDAQETKLQYFITAAKIKASDHVLEIGTGWGSFAIAAVRRTGCRVTSLTLSREQKELAEERIAVAGYTNRIKVLLCDYRGLPAPSGKLYDKVVSIEMLEAVGREYLDTYFECIDRLLKPQGLYTKIYLSRRSSPHCEPTGWKHWKGIEGLIDSRCDLEHWRTLRKNAALMEAKVRGEI